MNLLNNAPYRPPILVEDIGLYAGDTKHLFISNKSDSVNVITFSNDREISSIKMKKSDVPKLASIVAAALRNAGIECTVEIQKL